MGLFDDYDANPEDLPELGAKVGTFPATITNVERTFNVFKQDGHEEDPFITFTYQTEAAPWPVQHHFALPSKPQPWSETEIEYKSVTVADAMRQHLARLAKHLENCGVPRSKQNSIELADLIGIEGVVTMTERKGYINPTKFVVKQESGVGLPDAPSADMSGW